MRKLSLTKRLLRHHKTYTPMHMPGHKRNVKSPIPYALDITELPEFDDLNDSSGCLKALGDRAANLYGVSESFPLVGGSTCGIFAGIFALTNRKDTVLMARNCHKSVYRAVSLFGLTPCYILPECDDLSISQGITPEAVEKAFNENKDIKLVILTSPTYEGVLSDVKGISKVCKKHGASLFLDAAHGAHFGISDGAFSENQVKYADVSVTSLHKTLPALTQTALLHRNDTVSAQKVKNAITLFQTSSPSYILLASIDECVDFISHIQKPMNAFLQNLSAFYEKTKGLKHLSVTHFDDFSKIIISTKNASLSGTSLSEILRERYKIETELSAPQYVLAMATVCDTKKSLTKLLKALLKIDKTLTAEINVTHAIPNELPCVLMPPHKAETLNGECLPLASAVGKMSLEYVFSYPPGVPFLCPGEMITESIVERIQTLSAHGIAPKSTYNRICDNMLYAAPPECL